MMSKEEILFCYACKRIRDSVDFYPSEILKKTKCCKKCSYDKVKRSRNKNPVQYALIRKRTFRNNYFRSKLKKMNLGNDFYDHKLAEQNGKCAICGSGKYDRTNRRFAIDHCHQTEKIRGLLCGRCNMALGLLNDNLEILDNAIKYLRQYST